MSRIRRAAWALALAMVFGAALGSAPVQAEAVVNVLCSPNPAWCDAISEAFPKATGIRLAFVRLSSGEGLARLRAEKNNPGFDVWFGGTGDPHLVAFQEGLTEFYRPSVWEQLLPELRAVTGERYIPLYMGLLGWAVNEGLLRERGLPVPRTWQDLGDPRYRGLIATSNPNTSGTAYTMLATLVQIYGEEPAFELLKRMHYNIAQYTRSGAAPGLLAGRGEVAIGVTFLHDAVDQVLQGFPVRAVAPQDGTGFEVGGLSLVKGAPHRANAIRFIEWALTPEAQRLAATQGQSYQIPSNSRTPVPEAAPRPEEVKLIAYDFDTYGRAEVRDRLVQRWTREIFPLPRP